MEKEKEGIVNQERELVATTAQDKASRRLGEAGFAVPEDSPDALEDHDHKPADFSTFSKQDFVDLIKGLSHDTDFKKVDFVLREAKPFYDEIREKEREDALKAFIEGGGSQKDFEYRAGELDNAFDATYKLIRDKRNQFYRSQEELKTENLRRKNELLEQLRALVDGEDSAQSFDVFKEIQKTWKTTGPVPNAHSKTMWANYSALVDRFYDRRSIYFELKELDRKRNLEAKLELCVRAEKLMEVAKLKDAVRELNELHNDFKHIGPVPKEEKELAWQRFKAASDAIYQKRDAFLDNINKEQSKNLEEKLRIAEEVAAFAAFQTDRIKEWNTKTQEILALQKKWEGVGGVARSKARDVNKKFWTSFKAFFSRKNIFFKKLDEQRDKNLKAKMEIIRQAHELKESKDWEKTANALKELQRQWKEVGPIPEKMREKIFQEFKDACDFFFEQRRGQFEKVESDQEKNLHEKESICKELETLAESKTGTVEQFHDLLERHNAIGFVPRNSINESKARFRSAVDKFLALTASIPEDEKERLLMEIQLGSLKNDPDGERKIYQKEQTIRKRITKVENDIALLRNNVEFFGRSKNAEAVKAEFNVKIDEATEHLKSLKSQLKILKTV